LGESLASDKWTKLLPPELLHAAISTTPKIYIIKNLSEFNSTTLEAFESVL